MGINSVGFDEFDDEEYRWLEERSSIFSFPFYFILFYFIFAWRGVCVQSLTWVPSVNYR